MPFFVISVVIQVALVVHIVKTGRSGTWVCIVLIFPLVGSLAYFIIELLPELTNSRAARTAKKKFSKAVNPNRDLNLASQNLAVAGTVQNTMTLAEECLENAQFSEAGELYSRCLKGLYADDPRLLMGLAKAQFGLGDFQGTVQSLDTLKEKNPDYKSPEGHLLYARAQERLGNTETAIHEYEVLASYYAGPEPACRLALILKSRGNAREAGQLFNRVVNESKVAGKHYNSIHKEWVSLARREVG